MKTSITMREAMLLLVQEQFAMVNADIISQEVGLPTHHFAFPRAEEEQYIDRLIRLYDGNINDVYEVMA